MNDKISILDIALSLVASSLTFLFGDYDLPLKILVYAVILDYISGFLKAMYLGKFDSSVGHRGWIKKINLFMFVAVAHLLDHLSGTQLIRNPVIYCVVFNEFWSIVENGGQMGFKIPEPLRARLVQLNRSVEVDVEKLRDKDISDSKSDDN